MANQSEETQEATYGFPPGFSKVVEALLAVRHMKEITSAELRANLRTAGMKLDSDEIDVDSVVEDF